jgi:Cys-rich repeat protein
MLTGDKWLGCIAIAAAVMLLGGCGECKSNSDCPSGQVCRNGACVNLPGGDTSTDTLADTVWDGPSDSVADTSIDTARDAMPDGILECNEAECNAFCVEIGQESGHCEGGHCHCSGSSDVSIDYEVAPDLTTDGWSDPVEEWECTSEVECSDGNPCTTDHCSPVTHTCVFLNAIDGTECDDGVFCNGLSTCRSGTCMPGTPPCSSVEPICNPVYCDEMARECIAEQAPDGTDCDDGNWCNGPDECQDGICTRPGPQPCPVASEDPCMRIRCNETAESCDEIPKVNGALCADEDICDGQEYCQDGVCVDGTPLCDDGDPCTEDICHPGGDTTPPTCEHNDIC